MNHNSPIHIFASIFLCLHLVPLLCYGNEEVSDGEIAPIPIVGAHAAPAIDLPRVPDVPIPGGEEPGLQRGVHSAIQRKHLGRKSIVRLAEDPICAEDVRRVCGPDIRNNFGVLECIQNRGRTESDFINQKCHHLLWQYKLNLTVSGRVEDLARDVCDSQLNLFPECRDPTHPGHTLTCITQHLDKLTDEKCHQYLLKLAAIIFSDYRLVSHMTESCSEDINHTKCGRLQPLVEPSLHSQGYVIECLGKNISSLSQHCHEQILRLAELQADDFHLDRPLYFACRDDRENFCRTVRAGQGQVYKCLMKHKMERTMSKECVDKLSGRQKLVQEDYRVSQGLTKSCRSSIQALNCRRGVREGLGHSVKLAVILLCLEDGLRRGVSVDPSCQEEMLNHRRLLLEDYHLSPNLVVACKSELKRLCGGGKEIGGRTLHCLMKHARHHGKNRDSKLSPQCKRMVEDAVKVSDAGEDWRIDPVLHEACHPVVERACPSLMEGQARVMRCLMRQLNTPSMTGPCEAALLEIQYFVARDWKLDPQLYSACYNDSITKCHAKENWASPAIQDTDPDRGMLVLPCLFRSIYHTSANTLDKDQSSISEQCVEEVRRVMHERAAYVDLNPEIEEACLTHLGALCSDRTKPGEELLCLQENLEILSKDCHAVVSSYTEAEAKDIQLNSLINIHCTTVIQQVCKEEAREPPGEGAVMQCLIRNKNTQELRENPKCRIVVENFQILALKDIAFTPKFKKECHKDVIHFCDKSKTKKEVVDCLSKRVRDDLLQDDRSQVSRGCRIQLRNQLLQRHTSARLDPELSQRCSADIAALCRHLPHQQQEDQVLECLRNEREHLSEVCHEVVFTREWEELLDPGTDPVLLGACSKMIQLHCTPGDKEDLLTCLKRVKDSSTFSGSCRAVVVGRMIEQGRDVRLNPTLMAACRPDIRRHCAQLLQQGNQRSTEGTGLLTDCLQSALTRHALNPGCSAQVIQLTREAALNYRMDAQLTTNCDEEIPILCPAEKAEESEGGGGSGAVEECLKLALEQKRINSADCRQHIAQLVETQRVDINADPILHSTCAIDDVKFCGEQERGKHLACLLDVLTRNSAALERPCRELLRRRREMFRVAVKVSPLESFEDLVQGVVGSSQRNYLLLALTSIVVMIFIGGLFCGRTSRRFKLLKNR